MRRTQAEIYLENFRNNINQIKKQLKPGVKTCVAVKANAYGHGAVRISRECKELGVDFLAVAAVSEAEELRNNGVDLPILALSICSPAEITELVKNKTIPLVCDAEFITLLDHILDSYTPEELENYRENKGRFTVHLAVDTGMGRIGCFPENALELAKLISGSKHLVLGGMCTHFAVSDSTQEFDREYTDRQFERFNFAVDSVKNAGINPGIRHCCASAALVDHPQWQMDMVRPGIIAYGYYADQINREYLASKGIEFNLKPVMALVSAVCAVRPFDKGMSVSYGHTWTAQKDTEIAVITAGYGDGLLRRFAPFIKASINSKEYTISGRICMDQCMIEIGKNNPDVKRWDKVVLFGPEESGALCDAQYLADKTGTISYEILTGITSRVPRVYL